jgi:hypothetical protein
MNEAFSFVTQAMSDEQLERINEEVDINQYGSISECT